MFFRYDPPRKVVPLHFTYETDNNKWCLAPSPDQRFMCTMAKHGGSLHFAHDNNGESLAEWLDGDGKDPVTLCGLCHDYQSCPCPGTIPGYVKGLKTVPAMVTGSYTPPAGSMQKSSGPASQSPPQSAPQPITGGTSTPVPKTVLPKSSMKKEENWIDEWDLLPDA
jgi:hypothetical protein